MDVLAWAWWLVATGLGAAWTVLWFLIGGWVSTFLQIVVLIGVIYVLKYGWQRAPAEIWRRTRSFSTFFWNWVRARDLNDPGSSRIREVVRVVRVKEVGDINVSTLMSVAAFVGLGGVALLG
jgi:hypothetical protein